MGVETMDVPLRQDLAQRRRNAGRDLAEVGLTGRLPPESGDGGIRLLGPGLKLLDGLFEGAVLPD
jgi:hypothetical protein